MEKGCARDTQRRKEKEGEGLRGGKGRITKPYTSHATVSMSAPPHRSLVGACNW